MRTADGRRQTASYEFANHIYVLRKEFRLLTPDLRPLAPDC